VATTEEKKRNKRNKIINAAIEVFTEYGFHNARLDDVAKEANLGKGTLYLYFKSKEDLFMQCLLDGSEKNTELARKIIDGPGGIEERLSKLVMLQAESFSHNGPLIQQFIQRGTFFSDNSETADILFEQLQKKVGLTASFFESGIDSGIFTDKYCPMQMALIFHQLFDLNIKFQLFNVKLLPPEDCYETLFNLFAKKH
jgi:TetR/AcrR family fatty acid metabolism transcriptional regulator